MEDTDQTGKAHSRKSLKYLKIREELVEVDRKDYFTVDVSDLNEKEQKVHDKLEALREKLNNKDHVPYLKPYYEGKDEILESELFKALFSMPKGAHLHYHLTAAASIDLLMDLTREDIVYYNMDENKIKIFSSGYPDEGYTKCNIYRENWTKDGTFDEYIRSRILLNPEDLKSKFSNEIWNRFQYKFDLTFELYNYHKFFKRIVIAVLKNAVAENIFIVEFKHIFGCVLDDYGKSIDVDKEIEIFNECFLEVPEVTVKLIVCGLKIFGEGHIQEQLYHCIDQIDKTDHIAGFDLVNEEDTTPPLITFKKLITESKEKHKNLEILFHAGESTSRKNDNLYDAILLGTKRIGHGLAIANHPHLMEEIKRKQICIEVCPISNLVLGYVFDLRWHPGKFLLQRGVPICLNADDPGFFEAEGVSLDYAYATLAWELDLKDLKQLAINGIKYCSLTEEQKKGHMDQFLENWDKWIDTMLE